MKPVEAVKRFTSALLASDIGKRVAKVYFFGSWAKGEGRAGESDIDILVLTDDGKNVRERIADILTEFFLRYDAPVEVIVSSLSDLFPVRDYFIHNIMRYGKEVYSMPEKELRKEGAKNLKRLADEYLGYSEKALVDGFARVSVDEAYNSAELSAKGLIMLRMKDIPRTHGGIIETFSKLYVKPGEVEKTVGRQFNIAIELRNSARYKPEAVIHRDEAESVLDLARALSRILEEALEK